MSYSSAVPKSDRPPRLPANDRVVIRGLPGGAWTVNWSAQGFCLLAEDLLFRGDHHLVVFPDRYSRGEAEVVWARHLPDGCLAGLEFRSLDRRSISV